MSPSTRSSTASGCTAPSPLTTAAFASLGDLLRQIGHDERVHKLESLAGHDTARTNQTRTGLDSSARRAA